MELLINKFLVFLHLTIFFNSTMTISEKFLTMPSGPYSSQGCLSCTFDEERLCCKCPTTYYEKTFITEDPKSLNDKDAEKKVAFEHRFTGYQTVCLDAKKAMDCDGTVIYCGNHLICSYELLEYQKKGQC